ncbi:hypothetical protein NQ117_16485 [Paenibacillus sp. SC116]|nr:hypothetical protein [Paenibacillus sp. SC116]
MKRTTIGHIHSWITSQIEKLTTLQKVKFCLVALIYLCSNSKYNNYFSYSQNRYIKPMESILKKYIPRIVSGTRLTKKEIMTFQRYIELKKYHYTSLLVGDVLIIDDTEKSQLFYRLITDGQMYLNINDQNLVVTKAFALQRLERYKESLNMIVYLMLQNPLNKELRIFYLEIAAFGKLINHFEEQVNKLKEDFHLEDIDLIKLDRLRTQCYSLK